MPRRFFRDLVVADDDVDVDVDVAARFLPRRRERRETASLQDFDVWKIDRPACSFCAHDPGYA